MPISAHVAFNKACFYYDVELIIVGLNKDNSVNINEVKKAINKNTVMVPKKKIFKQIFLI